MDKDQALIEEAAVCRQLAREIDDRAAVAMFLERASELEFQASAARRRLANGISEPSLCAPRAERRGADRAAGGLTPLASFED